MAEIQILDQDNAWVSIKFPQTVSVSSLTNEHFRLFLNVSTPVEIIDPFNPIQIINDYDSISRVLTLRFKTQLNPDTPYLLTVTGLYDPAGRVLLDEEYYFTSTNSPQPSPLVPIPEPTYVIDYSVIPDAFSVDSVHESSGFYITSTEPEDPFIDNDFNNGRVIVKFSIPPNGNFVNSQYFKAQRKSLTRGFSRWESVIARVSLDGERPWVYVDFPSTDATPSYYLSGKTYFETGFKYRIKISKNIGT